MEVIVVKFANYYIPKVLILLESPNRQVIADQDTHGVQAGHDLACLQYLTYTLQRHFKKKYIATGLV